MVIAAHGSLRGISLRSADKNEERASELITFDDLKSSLSQQVKLFCFYSCNVGRVPLSDIFRLTLSHYDTIFVAFGVPVNSLEIEASCMIKMISCAIPNLPLSHEKFLAAFKDWKISAPHDKNESVYFFNDRDFLSTQHELMRIYSDPLLTVEKSSQLDEFIQLMVLTSGVPNCEQYTKNLGVENLQEAYDAFHIGQLISMRKELGDLFRQKKRSVVKYKPLTIPFADRELIDHLYVLCLSSCEGQDDFTETLLFLVHVFLTTNDESAIRTIRSAILFGLDPYDGSGRYYRFISTKVTLPELDIPNPMDVISDYILSLYKDNSKMIASTKQFSKAEFGSLRDNLITYRYRLPYPLVHVIFYDNDVAFILSSTHHIPQVGSNCTWPRVGNSPTASVTSTTSSSTSGS
jgi:hypothetical protein